MKLLANKRGSKYFVILFGEEYEIEIPKEKKVKKTSKKKSTKKTK